MAEKEIQARESKIWYETRKLFGEIQKVLIDYGNELDRYVELDVDIDLDLNDYECDLKNGKLSFNIVVNVKQSEDEKNTTETSGA